MPKKPIDWSRCIIYKIYKEGIDDFYVGSTTDFIKRKYGHKSASKIDEKKIYKIIRDNGGWDEWIMTAIEEYKECENQTQARIREEEWRVKLNATMNTIKAYLSIEEKKEQQKEYRELNKDIIKEKKKEYYYKNIDKLKEQKKEYRELNKDIIKEQQKEYRELNKEQKKEYDKEYKKNNINKIKEYKKETIYCNFCKKDINKNNKSQHYKTQLHINNAKPP
jgi:hypothetical protein